MKKITALILSVIMAVSLLPAAVFAAETVENTEGPVIGISGNLNLNSGDHSNKQLDIDGYTWNNTERVLTVKNLKIDGSLWLPDGGCEIVINGVLDVGNNITYTDYYSGDLKITGGKLTVNNDILPGDNLTLNNVNFTGGLVNNHADGESESIALTLTNSTVNADRFQWDTGNGVILQNSTINFNSTGTFFASKIAMDINSVITTTNNICSRPGGLDQIIQYLPAEYKIGETNNQWGYCDTIFDKDDNPATNLTIKHYHQYGEWVSGENEHWHECTVADCPDNSIIDRALHSFDQQIVDAKYLKATATCTVPATYFKSCVCGVASTTETFTNGTTIAHSFTVLQHNDTQHWNKCSRCDETDTKADHNYNGDNVCDTCGYNKTVPHTHEYEMKNDDKNHWKQCKGCGDIIEKAAHAYGNDDVCDACNYKKPAKPTEPGKPVEIGGGTTASDPERDFWYEVRKEVEASDKGDVVTVNAEEYNSMPWYVMDALRDNGVGMKIYWDGETIKIPAGKALNEKWRTYYPFEYLAKYNFDKMAEEIPAVPETGAPVNAVIVMAFVMAAAGTAIVLKRKIK